MTEDQITAFMACYEEFFYEPLDTRTYVLACAQFANLCERLRPYGALHYKVICDSTNNTTETKEQRNMIVDLIFYDHGLIRTFRVDGESYRQWYAQWAASK
jgi:hypothetical protein